MKVIILGAGKLGSEISNQTGWDLLSRKEDGIDAINFEEWKDRLKDYDVVVNCIANTDTYSTNEIAHRRINYDFVVDLSDYCSGKGIKLVHISTDYVYADSVSNASEMDIPRPADNWYSYTKLLADEYIQSFCKSYLICRLSHKPRPFPFDSAWVDVKTSADYVDVIADLVIKVIQLKAEGVYNIGTEPKTIFELASKSRNVNESYAPSHVPKDATMNIQRMKKLFHSQHIN
jgi:dTDP-4-dehydrorhamnose reductase